MEVGNPLPRVCRNRESGVIEQGPSRVGSAVGFPGLRGGRGGDVSKCILDDFANRLRGAVTHDNLSHSPHVIR